MTDKRYGTDGIAPSTEVGKDGARIKSTGGLLQSRNNADSAFAKVQGADSTVDDDLVTRRQLLATAGGQISSLANGDIPGVQANWQFEGDLLDSSGNGLTLTVDPSSPATPLYGKIDGKQGIYGRSSGGNRLDRNGTSDAALQITGALTLHVLAFITKSDHDTSTNMVWGFGGSGEAEAANFLYSLRLSGSAVFEGFHEHNSGVNDTATFEAGAAVGKWSLYTLTRPSAGTSYSLYLDGTLLATVTGVTAATGGTAAEVVLDDWIGYLGGVGIGNVEASAAQVLAAAQSVGVAA